MFVFFQLIFFPEESASDGTGGGGGDGSGGSSGDGPNDGPNDGAGGSDNSNRPDPITRDPNGFPDYGRDPDATGREFGRTIEVRDNVERSDNETNRDTPEHNVEDRSSTEHSEINAPEDRSPTRGDFDRGPHDKPDRELPKSAEYAKKEKAVIDTFYQGDYKKFREERDAIIRCGDTNCNGFEKPQTEADYDRKEFEDAVKDIAKDIGKNLLKGKVEISWKQVKNYATKVETMGDEDQGFQKRTADLDKVADYKGNESTIDVIHNVPLDRFPDLKTPEELSHPRMEQRKDYINYYHY